MLQGENLQREIHTSCLSHWGECLVHDQPSIPLLGWLTIMLLLN